MGSYTMINNFALIIGAMKCGTTSLFAYLAQHPQISACSDKEPCFFSQESNWSKGVDWYQKLWDWDFIRHKIALEASTSYTRIPTYLNAAEKISTIDANFKFIYVIRNPIDRIESHYTYKQSIRQAKELLTQNISLTRGIEIDRDLIITSQYARQLEEYYKRFSTDSILILYFDDLKAKPLKILKEICHFLEIDPDYKFQEIDTIHNENKGRIVNDPLWRLLKRLEPLRPLAKLVSNKQKQRLHCLFGRPLEGNFKLTPEQRNFVLNELQEDLRKLSSGYGVDISRWRLEG